MKNKIVILVLLLAASGTARADSGTVIGNGGDPIFYFLRSTRHALIQTIRDYYRDPEIKEKFCKNEILTEEQVAYCNEYTLEVLEKILTLNLGENQVPFVLRQEPLLVEGPEGEPMPVAARTISGPEGSIEFHRPSIYTMAPDQVLFLITHEFQHKVLWQERYLDDFSPVGPFHSGRDLLDSVGLALAQYAKKRGRIGSQYGLRDSFRCHIQNASGNFGVRASSPRRFFSNTLMSYQTSLGKNPTDASIYIPETSTTDLVFQLLINEPANCSEDTELSRDRYTELLLIRTDRDLDTSPETAASEMLEGFNPICEQDSSELEIHYRDIVISCSFSGTEGTTTSAIGLSEN